jgi:thioredoxin reductase
METKEVVIIGAGPYGLSAAAHLQHAGMDPYVIGRSMSFWKDHMPGGMLLRSRIEASNIAAPQKHLSIFAYQKAIKRSLPEPLPIEDFIAYGEWFQKQVAPHVDTRQVKSISRSAERFQVTMQDGESIPTKYVVMALGIGAFAFRPQEFETLPASVAPHSSELRNLSEYQGQRVLVVGKGQSALEYAALLHEAGAHVEIITRGSRLTFRPFAWRKHLFRSLTPGPLRGISYKILPPTDLGDIHTARKIANPEIFRRQSTADQESLLKDCTKPVGAYWLPKRLATVPVKTGVSINNTELTPSGIKLHLSDGRTHETDVVVLCTGYKIDISKYRILDNTLEQMVSKTAEGYPVLETTLQTTVKGLYMAGVIAEKTLGPTLRFVTGTSNAGSRLAAGLTGNGNRRSAAAGTK